MELLGSTNLVSNYSMVGLSDFTIFIVVKASSLINYASCVRLQESPGTNYIVYPWQVSALAIHEPDGATVGVSSGMVANVWNKGSMRRRKNITTNGLETRRNGAAVANRTAANSNVGSFCSKVRIGGRFDNTELMTGNMAEIMVFDRALSDAEIGNMESYFTTKWGV